MYYCVHTLLASSVHSQQPMPSAFHDDRQRVLDSEDEGSCPKVALATVGTIPVATSSVLLLVTLH